MGDFHTTEYGFQWGAATFTRAFSDDAKGWQTTLINTPKVELQVYVTRTGKVRVHDSTGREWLPGPSKRKEARDA